MDLSVATRLLNIFIRGGINRQGDIFLDCAFVECWFLTDETDLFAVLLGVKGSDVLSIVENLTG